MKQQRTMMGMTINVEIPLASEEGVFDDVFNYFKSIDERFSTYKESSEISRINRKEIAPEAYSPEMREVLEAAEATKRETGGYFSITRPDGSIDPSGIVKGWAIRNAARLLESKGYTDFYIDAGGDIEVRGGASGGSWTVGIRDPFRPEDRIVKVLKLTDCGVATSGTYARGSHIYNPHNTSMPLDEIVSITVIGHDIYEADRFATAAFAMQRDGIEFIESLNGFEGYMIDKNGIATMTSGFTTYTNA